MLSSKLCNSTPILQSPRKRSMLQQSPFRTLFSCAWTKRNWLTYAICSHKLLTISRERPWREERGSFNRRTSILRDTGRREDCHQCLPRRERARRVKFPEMLMRWWPTLKTRMLSILGKTRTLCKNSWSNILTEMSPLTVTKFSTLMRNLKILRVRKRTWRSTWASSTKRSTS